MQNPVDSPVPRVLLVEDDPTSRLFLGNALRTLPAEIDGADSLAAALALARTQDYALWLIDAHLPDGDGVELLQRLRAQHPNVPAIAHTASDQATTLARLQDAGFAEVLVKPLPAAAVRSAVRRVLQLPAATPAPSRETHGAQALWDDEAAAIALNGNRSHIDTLRALFLDELPHTHERIVLAARAGDVEQLHGELHKLRASCGFVGAARLGAAVHALQLQPDAADRLDRFDATAKATLDNQSPA